MSNEPDDDEDEGDDPEEVFVEREIAQADPEGVELKPDHAPRRDHQRRLVDVVGEWLIEGRSYLEIVDLAIEATGCSDRTAKRAIAEVRKRWKAQGAATFDDKRDLFVARAEAAWSRAYMAGDYRAVAAMMRPLIDVLGLKSANKIEISGLLGLRPVAALSPAERRAEIAELQAKMLASGGPPADDDEPATVPAKRKRGN